MNPGSLEPYYSLLLITRQIPSVPTVTVGQTASQCFPAFRLAPVSWSHQWNYRGSNRSNSTGSLLVRVATSQYEFVHSLGTTSNSSTDWGKQSSSGWRFFRNSLHFFFPASPSFDIYLTACSLCHDRASWEVLCALFVHFGRSSCPIWSHIPANFCIQLSATPGI